MTVYNIFLTIGVFIRKCICTNSNSDKSMHSASNRVQYLFICVHVKRQSSIGTCRQTNRKSKAVPLHAMEALGGGERRYSSYSFSTSALDGGEWSASRPGHALPPGKGPQVPIVQEAGWAPEPVWTQRLEEKSLPLRQTNTCTILWTTFLKNFTSIDQWSPNFFHHAPLHICISRTAYIYISIYIYKFINDIHIISALGLRDLFSLAPPWNIMRTL